MSRANIPIHLECSVSPCLRGEKLLAQFGHRVQVDFRRCVPVALVMLLLAVGCGGQQLVAAGNETATAEALAAQEEARTVVAEARVVPVASAELRFLIDGFVGELLVAEGQQVAQGAPLARLDTRDLELRCDEARAALAQQQAAYAKLIDGAAPEQIAAAEAALAQQRGQRDEAVGAVSAADIAAAEAALLQARTALARLEAGADSHEIVAAEARLDQARETTAELDAALQQTRDSASKAKTDAELALQQATISLQQAQSDYSLAYWNYRSAVGEGHEPSTHQDDDTPALSDYGALKQREEFRKAELTLAEAQRRQQQAQVDLEAARQDELTAIRVAEHQFAVAGATTREAQAELDDLVAGADADEVARARASVAAAQAALDKLNGLQRSGQIAAAEAGVASAAAHVDELKAPPRAAELGELRAQIQAGAIRLRQAEVALDKATLKAPIDGTVVALNIKLGERADPDQAVIIIADLSQIEIETSDLTEIDMVRVRDGAPALISFDALPGVTLPGRVRRVKSLGENTQGDVTYTVTIALDRQDPRLRWNMTAQVRIAA